MQMKISFMVLEIWFFGFGIGFYTNPVDDFMMFSSDDTRIATDEDAIF